MVKKHSGNPCENMKFSETPLKILVKRSAVFLVKKQGSNMGSGHFESRQISGKSIVGWLEVAPMKKSSLKAHLGGGFKHFLFSSLLGEDSHFD